MKRFFLNLLGILLFGALFSGIIMIGEHARIKREQENTVSSTRYEIVVRSGYIVQDHTQIEGVSSPYRLKVGRQAELVLDFFEEPAIREFADSHAEAYVEVQGIARTLPGTTDTPIVVVEVLKLRILRK